jgi:hypothetical protein
MEACQVLRVNVRVAGSFVGERFLARMTRDDRLTIPKLALRLLWEGEEESARERKTGESRHKLTIEVVD